jgi:hypothetical protein
MIQAIWKLLLSIFIQVFLRWCFFWEKHCSISINLPERWIYTEVHRGFWLSFVLWSRGRILNVVHRWYLASRCVSASKAADSKLNYIFRARELHIISDCFIVCFLYSSSSAGVSFGKKTVQKTHCSFVFNCWYFNKKI